MYIACNFNVNIYIMLYLIYIDADDAEKVTSEPHGSVRLKQHLHNKKGIPNREHRCGVGQIPFEGQVRTSHNSRVLERGKLYVP